MFYDLLLNAPMDIDDIRRANIQILEKEAGSKKAAAERVGMTYVQYLNYRNGAKEAKTGKVRGMRKETAWKFEAAYDKPRGWLDTNHDPTTNRVAESRATYHLPKRHARRLVQDLIDLALANPGDPLPEGLSPSVRAMVNMARAAIGNEINPPS